MLDEENELRIHNDEITVVIPPLKHVLKEGDHDLSLEVIVDDKIFVPLKVTGNFEKSLSITAEAVNRKARPSVKASASLVNSKSRKQNVISERTKVKSNNKPTKRRKSVVSDKEIMDLIKMLSSK
jgi:hypothetical protein